MKWLCWFFPHKWIHIVDGITIGEGMKKEPKGIYQCKRCKKLGTKNLERN